MNTPHNNDTCAVLGLGNLGRLFAGGALRLGTTVVPIPRQRDPHTALQPLSPETPILLGVSERDLPTAVASIPPERLSQTIWLQNGLSPKLWRALLPPNTPDPTILVVWTNCKPSSPLLIGQPSAVFGPHAPWVASIHAALNIPCTTLSSFDQLLAELAAKDAFILAVNSLGVLHNQPLGTWLQNHPQRVQHLVSDCATLAIARTPAPQASHDEVLEKVYEAMRAMPTLGTRGRTAFERVQQATHDANTLSLRLKHLEREGLYDLNAFKS